MDVASLSQQPMNGIPDVWIQVNWIYEVFVGKAIRQAANRPANVSQPLPKTLAAVARDQDDATTVKKPVLALPSLAATQLPTYGLNQCVDHGVTGDPDGLRGHSFGQQGVGRPLVSAQ